MKSVLIILLMFISLAGTSYAKDCNIRGTIVKGDKVSKAFNNKESAEEFAETLNGEVFKEQGEELYYVIYPVPTVITYFPEDCK